jgi:hypothetical protein
MKSFYPVKFIFSNSEADLIGVSISPSGKLFRAVLDISTVEQELKRVDYWSDGIA